MGQRDKKLSAEALKWALSNRDPLELPWPEDAAGKPEEPAWLTNLGGSQLDFELAASMLRACGIPLLRIYPGGRLSLRVIMGFTGHGLDLYVPESLLEDARALLDGRCEIVGEELQ